MDIESLLIRLSCLCIPICIAEVVALAIIVADNNEYLTHLMMVAIELTILIGIAFFVLAFVVAYIKDLIKKRNERRLHRPS